MLSFNRRKSFERYLVAGSAIFVIGFTQYHFFYALTDAGKFHAGTTWAIHFIVGTIWSHAVHRRFTFRDETQHPYFRSLFLTFAVYVVMLAFSTALMILLCDIAGFHHMLGWGLTTVLTGVGNFLSMSRWTICCASRKIIHGS